MITATTLSAARRLSLSPSLSRTGWGRRVTLALLALIGSAVLAAGAVVAERQALWQVVRVCALDKSTTGSPLPCLDVELKDGEARGYAVLRPPFGEPDTILTPTRRIIGIEDAALQAPDIPNYFALAWKARSLATHADGRAPPEDRVALAVNSRLARSQDQMHIHIGCLASRFSRQIKDAIGPKTGEWRRAADLAPGLEMWTYRAGARDWNGLLPFRLASDLVGGDAAALARMTLAVAPIRDDFLVVAFRSRPGGWYASAEDVIDPRCR